MRADDGDTVTITAATYRRLHERRRIAEALLAAEVEHSEHVRAWAEKAFAEQRRLGERCTFLYDKAIEHGASRHELMQGTWGVQS